MAGPVASIFGPEAPSVKLNFQLHAGQLEVGRAIRTNFRSAAPASIVEIVCSRGWGKTLFMGAGLLVPYLDRYPTAKVMWVAPTYLIAMSLIDDVFRGVDEVTGLPYVPEYDHKGRRVWEFVTTKSGPMVKWWNGATIIFRSADSPDSIVSKGFNQIIIDEAALIDQKVFEQQILGTARKRGIKIFLISTPRGKKHWTYRMFLKGQDANETEYVSFQQPYTKNPYFSPVLAKLIKDIPDWIYRQEYLAEFIEDGDSVFRGLDQVMFGSEITFPGSQQEWSEDIGDVEIIGPDGKRMQRLATDRTFVVGLDIAKSVDFSVIWAMDLESGDLVYYRRVNKMDYRDLLDMVSAVCKTHNGAELIFDATGVGAGLGDMLNNYDITTHPYIFTNESKVELVNKLILSIEYQEIKIPNIQEVRKELSVFTYSMTRTGKISYNAPSGFHDDIVMSMALANWYRKESGPIENVGVIDEISAWNGGGRDRDRPRSILEDMDDDND